MVPIWQQRPLGRTNVRGFAAGRGKEWRGKVGMRSVSVTVR